MFYDFIYLAKGFRMRPKVWSTLTLDNVRESRILVADGQEVSSEIFRFRPVHWVGLVRNGWNNLEGAENQSKAMFCF